MTSLSTTNMEIKIKPITHGRTQIGKAFDELVAKLPILKWDQEQKKRRNKIKL